MNFVVSLVHILLVAVLRLPSGKVSLPLLTLGLLLWLLTN